MAGKQRAAITILPCLGRVSRTGWFRLLFAVVALSVIVQSGLALKPYADKPVQDMRWDVDWNVFIPNLERVHGFRDTLKWWTGPWCGLAPYWRPLSSYAFLAEQLAWGPWYMLPRQAVLVLLHVCFVALAGLLLFRLTGRRWLALLAVWLFAGWRPYPIHDIFGLPGPVWSILCNPKNLPEPMVGIAIIVSLLLTVRGRWVPALAVAATGVGFKEMGYAAWLLAPTVLAWTNRDRVFAPGGAHYVAGALKRNRGTIITWVAVLVLLLAINWMAVGHANTLGFRPSTLSRFGMYFGGPIAVDLISHDTSSAYAAALIYASLVATRRRRLLSRFAAVLAAFAVAIMLDARVQGVTWDVSMARFLSWRLDLPAALACLIWLLVAETALRDRRAVAMGLGLCLVASVPTWIGKQALEHTRYIPSFFMEAAVAAALIVSVKHMLARVTERGDTA